MHQLKEQARMMKEALLKGRLHEIGEILDFGFQQKGRWQPTSAIQASKNCMMPQKAGATGGKISGAGGGGL